jgi:hypothetical protein
VHKLKIGVAMAPPVLIVLSSRLVKENFILCKGLEGNKWYDLVKKVGGFFMIGVMGFGSLLITIVMPLAVIFLLVWTYKIKRNSDIQVEQNNKIIKLLEKETNQ